MQYNFLLILLGLIAIQDPKVNAATLDPVQTILNYGKALFLGDDDDDKKDSDDAEDEKPVYMQNETRTIHNDTFYSGYFPVDDYQSIFYILFESRNNQTRDTDPLIVWIRGEAGCSTTGNMFDNMSPLIFGVNETTGQPALVNNPNSWNNFTNMLYVDIQLGTGYSFARTSYEEFEPRVFSIDYVVSDFIHFMKGFLDFHT
jgi:carboxypeptidase C (cathepsin A)